MKKLLLICMILLVLPMVSVFDEELIQCVGGDSELCITALGDEELFFMGPVPSEIIEITGPVVREEKIEPELEPKKELKGKLFIVCIIFLLLFTFFIILKDEEEEEKKKD